MFGRGVHQIPIVDMPAIPQVGPENPLSKTRIAALKPPNEHDERQQSFLVHRGMQKPQHIRQGNFRKPSRHRPHLWDPHAEKPIAFRVFTLAGFEEALEDDGLAGVGVTPKDLTCVSGSA